MSDQTAPCFTDAELTPYGWAKGEYSFVCPICITRVYDVDKHSIRCRSCAAEAKTKRAEILEASKVVEAPKDTWTPFYAGLARYVATKSKDPSTKVGAVIVRPDNTCASFGYNGFPRGVDDTPERYADRDFKLAAIMHAEQNAVLNAREPVKGYRLFSTFHPCARCASLIVQAGIREVIVPDEEPPERWRAEMEIARTILREGGVMLGLMKADEPPRGKAEDPEDDSVVTFRAEDLLSKFGFGDGDMLRSIEEAAGYPDKLFLADAVRHFLVPSLPKELEIIEPWGAVHNPIRAAWDTDPDLLRGFEVTVPASAVIEFIRATAARRRGDERRTLDARRHNPAAGMPAKDFLDT